ncbi:FdhF/YdeP family oxidoreductase [Opitutus terrae]|uniref:Oxidoreductase alpha (Molybdopterin) subunit n=1 Tax=Opitutus terrae (strain DSM 11246 / JCM 15787 / PB90-1) TaxID=452637 RepID=B2A084_OPITP|nr:FdhF/YdeP family oxidoreductase [Opitutus terrae]ACB77420.1 oxidoreductase alpha (molybdopterin) subunit [Opitutus terrae PB90-1]
MPVPRSVSPAQTPIEVAGTQQKKPYQVAGGLRALREVAGYGLRHSGLGNTLKTFHAINQTNGFDCQSCAWPNPDGERSFAEFCENGFKAVTYEVTKKRVDAEFFQQHSVADLGTRSDYWLGEQGRLTEPMLLRPGGTHYEPIGWDEAFQLLARELRSLGSPHEAVFYTSGRTSNEAAFLWQLFVRAFGTNNLPDCSNMCHESTSVALPPMLGIGKGCVRLSDFEKADAIFIIGQNPGTNHPRMLTALQQAKARGCRVVSVNPLPEVGTERFKNPQDLLHPTRLPRFFLGGGTPLSDLWLPVMINGDLAFFTGLMKEMLEAEDRRPGTVFDRGFIRHHTEGFEALVAQLRASAWNDIIADSGLTREQIRAAAQIAMESHRIIACWCMGVTQHHNAVATIQQIVNFLLLGGHIGRPGAGPCPVRGHSNVQGDRTMGIWENPRPEFLDRLRAEFGFEPPRQPGFDTVEAIRAMNDGRAHVFIAMGGNFLSATSDTEFTAAGLRRCRLTAHVATKLNRSHVVTGGTALILPCLGRTEIDRQATGEQFVTVEDSMGVISSSRGHLTPCSAQLLSEPAIVAGLAKATLGPKSPLDWEAHVANYDRIRDRIEAVVPGFPAFNDRIREGTFYLPNPPRDERRFATPSGKAVFRPAPLSRAAIEPGQYLLTTIRSHDQFNTSIYGLDDRYRGIYNGRRVVFLNPEDIAAAGLMQGQLVDLTSHFNGRTRRAAQFMVAPYAIPRRCAAAYFPEANVLVPIDSVAEGSNCPTSKSIPITIAPSAEQRPQV